MTTFEPEPNKYHENPTADALYNIADALYTAAAAIKDVGHALHHPRSMSVAEEIHVGMESIAEALHSSNDTIVEALHSSNETLVEAITQVGCEVEEVNINLGKPSPEQWAKKFQQAVDPRALTSLDTKAVPKE